MYVFATKVKEKIISALKEENTIKRLITVTQNNTHEIMINFFVITK